jgi:predicted dithiol-disulfide oxidoreductase (DUF899 family)
MTAKLEARTVDREEWLAARKALLEREKAFTREREALSAARRALPRVRVEKEYVLRDEHGEAKVADLFGGKRQLIVYHFMFAPGAAQGCAHCSYVADHFDGVTVHLAARDTAFVVVSRASIEAITAFKKRMGWRFRWLSAGDSGFNHDYGAAFQPDEVAAKRGVYNYRMTTLPHPDMPGFSVFSREGDAVYHNYSTYSRGIDLLINTYNFLDLTPLGRDEGDRPMAWVRYHDRYEGG